MNFVLFSFACAGWMTNLKLGKKIYTELAKEGKTEPAVRIHYEVGSAEAQGAELEKLNNLIKNSKKGDKYLVVGYASTDGEPEANYKLSSERASNAAQKIANSKKASKDDIQAVYFGETTRFHATEMPPNRVVEVWKVK